MSLLTEHRINGTNVLVFDARSESGVVVGIEAHDGTHTISLNRITEIAHQKPIPFFSIRFNEEQRHLVRDVFANAFDDIETKHRRNLANSFHEMSIGVFTMAGRDPTAKEMKTICAACPDYADCEHPNKDGHGMASENNPPTEDPSPSAPVDPPADPEEAVEPAPGATEPTETSDLPPAPIAMRIETESEDDSDQNPHGMIP
jgi:hypothetical protein